MISIELGGVPDRLWSRVASAPRLLLMLDYDGTLAPFHVRREEARPHHGVVALLGRIVTAGRTEAAVISGRPVGDVQRLLGPLPILLVGEHGWEILRADGRHVQHPLDDATAAALERMAAAATAAGLGTHLERKRCSIVLHTRGQSPGRADEMTRAGARLWEEEARRAGLRLERIDGGLELRAGDRDKGVIVRELIAASSPEAVAVYLGDDATDEDAFRAVQDRGYGIRVGPEERSSLASGRLPSVDAVVVFLERWLAIVRAAPVQGDRHP